MSGVGGLIIGSGIVIPQPSGIVTPITIFGAKCVAWFTADAGITHASGVISAWVDQVGGLSLAPGAAGTEPTYSATGWDGTTNPSVSFDGGDYLRSAALPGAFPVGTAASEMLAVFNNTSAAGDADATRALGAYGGTTNGTFREMRRASVSGADRFRTSTGAELVTATSTISGKNHARSLWRADATMVASVNGDTPVSGGFTGTTGSTRLALGNTTAGTTTGYEGHLRDIVVLNDEMSAGEITAWNAYAGARAA